MRVTPQRQVLLTECADMLFIILALEAVRKAMYRINNEYFLPTNKVVNLLAEVVNIGLLVG